MANARRALTQHLHDLYLDQRGKSYYCMTKLDKKIDNAASRMSSDVDLLSQFGCEFFFGGVINPETGMLLQIVTFFFVCYVSASATYDSTGTWRWSTLQSSYRSW